MKLLGTARLALNRIWATKVRSLLTMLGVVIGVAAIVALTSIVDGASQGINKSLATLGTNQLNITAMAPDALTEQDANALAELDGVSVMFVQTSNEGTIATEDKRVNARLVGVSAEYFQAVKPEIAMGAYLSNSKFAASAKDVVFGADAANDLGLTDSMLGQTVKLNGQDFRLVGVLDDQAGFGTNGRVYVTLDSARKLFSQYPYVSSIVVQAETPEAVDALQLETDRLLRERYGLGTETDARYTITNQASLIAAVSSITDTLGLLLTGIAGISLVVGGIGIMNIMLVSVRERTREIGVRRAIGAKQSNILTQFLIEAIVLSLAGGVVGLILGEIAAYFLAIIGDWVFSIQLETVLGALGFSLVVGVVFGVWPARTAAKLEPIDALRFE
ncbi:MAG: ABC transporter permease [Aquiluna sp.]|nr:ABC transporter permease [Aquiluna sp.]